jgi:hypothetical protein
MGGIISFSESWKIDPKRWAGHIQAKLGEQETSNFFKGRKRLCEDIRFPRHIFTRPFSLDRNRIMLNQAIVDSRVAISKMTFF